MAATNTNTKPEHLIAVIVGNDRYSHPSNTLVQSVNNAKNLSKALMNMRFDVTTVINATRQQLSEVFTTLSKTVKENDLVFFYFSGHCYQINGLDYMIPVDDAQIDSEADVTNVGLNLQETLSQFADKTSFLATVVALDCTSSYVLGEDRKSKSTPRPRGMRRIRLPRGVIIQFACDPDQTIDGTMAMEQNTLYAKAFIRHIAQEQASVETVFKSIEDDVYRASNCKQRPSMVSRLPRGLQICFTSTSEKPRLCASDFFTNEPLSNEEKNYFDECKEYYNLTKQPLVCIADELVNHDASLSRITLKLAIDEPCHQFDLQGFLDLFCHKIGLPQEYLSVRRIQKGSTVLEADIEEKLGSKCVKLKMIYQSLTDEAREALAQLKLFFMFFGPIESLRKIQKFRSEIRFNPQFNRVYAKGHDYWEGPLNDGRDRGGNPYFCPVGWRRWSFYVTDNFYERFKGWSICYHGTKFEYGLAILLSGLKPAWRAEHGSGIYASPSVNYVCHPRYAEVKRIRSSAASKFFKYGKYVQFVLECRVHPENIRGKRRETLNASNTIIDYNISNDNIEWIINDQNKEIVDFHDPDASIVCSGIMVRITDEHPGLLPQSEWWLRSHLCNHRKCCLLDIDLPGLKQLKNSGKECHIIYE